MGAVRGGGAEFLARWLVGMLCQTGERPPTLSPSPLDKKNSFGYLERTMGARKSLEA